MAQKINKLKINCVSYDITNESDSELSKLKNDIGQLKSIVVSCVGSGEYHCETKVKCFTGIFLEANTKYIIEYNFPNNTNASAITAAVTNGGSVQYIYGSGSKEFTPTTSGELYLYTSSTIPNSIGSISVNNPDGDSLQGTVKKIEESVKILSDNTSGDIILFDDTVNIEKSKGYIIDLDIVKDEVYTIQVELTGISYVNFIIDGVSGSTLKLERGEYKYTAIGSGKAKLYNSSSNGTVKITVKQSGFTTNDFTSIKRDVSTSSVVCVNVTAEGDNKNVSVGTVDQYEYPSSLYWGTEYLAPWYQKLFANQNVKIVFEGDSITEGDLFRHYDGTLNGYRQDCLRRIFDLGGYGSEVTIINNGHGNRATNEWIGNNEYYHYPSDSSDAPNGWLDVGMSNNPDLLICAHGINDAVRPEGSTIEERLERFETNYREALERIRGTSSVNGRPSYRKSSDELGIVLCMPTHATNKTVERRDENWHTFVRKIIMKLAREYHCAYIDFAQATQNMSWSVNNVWGVTEQGETTGSGIHPRLSFTLAYASIYQPVILPVGLWKQDTKILTSPNGTRYALRVSDTGTISTTLA